MRKLDNGHLTAADRATLNQQQNAVQGHLQAEARCPDPERKSQERSRAAQRNQQERIAQGVKSGQLTAGETAHLEGREAAINKEVHNDRVANGGKLTAGRAPPGEPPAKPHLSAPSIARSTTRASSRSQHSSREVKTPPETEAFFM